MKRPGEHATEADEEARLRLVANHIDHAEPLPPINLGEPIGAFAKAVDVLTGHFSGPTTTAGIA